MITANQLSLLATVASAVADGREHELESFSGSNWNEVGIAANDARREAQASNGFSTAATLHMHMQFSEREHYYMVLNMTEGVYTSDSETKRADLMDAFKAYCEVVIGEDHDGITGAMIRCGMWEVDWHNLADFYLTERALNDR